MYSQMSFRAAILLLMDEVKSAGRKYAAISASMDITAEPRAKMLRNAERRVNHSRDMATTPPNQAEVVRASNILEFGQRPEMYQRTTIEALCARNAMTKRTIPMVRARFHL